MVSPNLIKKKESSLSIDTDIKRLFQLIYVKKNNIDISDGPKDNISVSNIGSSMAFVYEKIRNAVDYDDENLLRKNAIKRILKRQIFIEGIVKKFNSKEASLHLLTELIQAGYLPNDQVPETKVSEVSNILSKYIKLKQYSFEKEGFFSALAETIGLRNKRKRTNKAKRILNNWIIALAAAEIEDNVSGDVVRKEMVSEMFEILQENIKLPNDLPFANDLDIQIYLSICRTFLNNDDELLHYIVFKYYIKDWKNADDAKIQSVAKKIDKLYLASNSQLNHPLAKQLDKIIKSYSLYFSILQEAIENNPLKTYELAVNDYKAFMSYVKEIASNRYKKIKKKLWSAGWRSIIYIFLTKSIFVFAIEIPAIQFFGEELHIFALAINIAFPAILLLFMIMMTWAPAKANQDKILQGVEEVVFVEKRKRHSIILRKPPRRNMVKAVVFNTLYFVGFSITMYAIIRALIYFGFNWVNIIIFVFFLTFVSFFSFRIKRDIKRFIIVEPKDGFFSFLADFLYMPIVAIGKFLSDNASRVNIFIFILDFIIEAPFKVFVEIFDDWVKYIKERREDLIN